jgi:hypothetical protein
MFPVSEIVAPDVEVLVLPFRLLGPHLGEGLRAVVGRLRAAAAVPGRVAATVPVDFANATASGATETSAWKNDLGQKKPLSTNKILFTF